MDGVLFEKQYKYHLSGYPGWEHRGSCAESIIFPENIGPHLSIDETCLSQDEVYTIVTNKAASGRKGSLVAMVRGTESDRVVSALKGISPGKRREVKEVTLDLSPSMRRIVRLAFPGAVLVNDRFHVQKLFSEAMDDLRIKHRWEAMDEENAKVREHRRNRTRYVPYVFENGDTRRQLLFRSRRLLLIHQSRWTEAQKTRASILFRLYPDIREAYDRYLELVSIYNTRIDPGLSPGRKEFERARLMTRLARWYNNIDRMKSRCFHIVLDTFKDNYLTILNYFDNRSTNASAESFNAKVKAFRNQFRGVRDIPFFIFRLAKIFA